MIETLEELEFIGSNFTWRPVVTGNAHIDYLYGFRCAYRYSEWLEDALTKPSRHRVMQSNVHFRQSINLFTSEGQGFQDGITGKPSKYSPGRAIMFDSPVHIDASRHQ